MSAGNVTNGAARDALRALMTLYRNQRSTPKHHAAAIIAMAYAAAEGKAFAVGTMQPVTHGPVFITECEATAEAVRAVFAATAWAQSHGRAGLTLDEAMQRERFAVVSYPAEVQA